MAVPIAVALEYGVYTGCNGTGGYVSGCSEQCGTRQVSKKRKEALGRILSFRGTGSFETCV